MKLHRLTIAAIGPFPGEHTLDFDALGVSGLFLLTGPTGSGKSTLLDAIEFALYGSGSGSMKERLPSGHAPRGVTPRVELVFSNARGIYRVERIPEHVRQKVRGDGLTTEKTRGTLVRLTSLEDLDAAGEPVTAHVQELTPAIQEIVGLTRDQFTQTVILPQGKFANFLKSPPEARGKLLQDVFGTQVYRAAQQDLNDRAGAAGARVKEAEAVVSNEWHHLRSLTAPAAERAGFSVEEAPQDMPAEAERLVAAASSEEETARAAAELARTTSTAASVALADARTLTSRLDRRDAARTALTELESAAGQIAEDRARAEAAARAAEAMVSLRHAERASRTAQDTAATLAAAMEACREGGVAVAGPEHLREELEKVQIARESLAGALQIEKELGRNREKAEQIAATSAGKKADGERLTEALAALPGRRAALNAARTEQLAAAKDEAPAAAARQLAADRAQAAEALAAGELEAARVREEAATMRSRAEQAQRHVENLHRQWLASLAGELAEDHLTDGEPCPVCGSEHHPEPAERPEGAPSRQDVAEARAASENSDSLAAEAATRLAEANTRVSQLQERLGGRHPAAAQEELEAAELRLARAREAAQQASDLEEALRTTDAEAENLRAEQEKIKEALAALQSEAAVLASTITGAEAKVAAARGAHPTVLAAVQEAEARVASVKAAEGAFAESQTAARLHQDAAAQLATSLQRQGFADAEAVLAASLHEAEAQLLKDKVASHQERLIATRAALEDPELAGLGARPDLAAAQAAAEEAEKQAVAAGDAAGATHQTLVDAQEALTALRRAITNREEVAASSAALVAMADAANGRNSRRTTLASYVLFRRFEEVLAAANRRLAVMSEDRYQLIRSTEREAGQRALNVGLSVEVMDHELERTRSPHSLSGGETFYTSLALALGLADTVTDEAGGIELGTLFVDEGFGSLDPDALENVMSVLRGLSSGGRAVGIVSHVTELRSRIPEQVVVSRLEGGGSTLRVDA